ncbi:MAG: YdcH family protein [Deltaproteobacteria bacterium]|nr:YdcH family protein [Deltaproteobacteria bacterium]
MPDETPTTSEPTPQARLDELRKEHRDLDAKITDLTSRPYLTAQDQMEVAGLKKLKLRKKDEILTMASKLGVEI